MFEHKQRIVQEQVPGKQVTLAHIIASPDKSVLDALNLPNMHESGNTSIAVLTVTPAQTAIIYADVGVKVSGVCVAQLNCSENGSFILTGTVSQVQAAVYAILDYAKNSLGCEICSVTQT